MDRAACTDQDPDLFFPISETGPGLRQIAAAKEICAHCPVTAECLEWAVRTSQPDGVWGGRSAAERRAGAPYRPAMTSGDGLSVVPPMGGTRSA
jgi:WhiB family redox-sensing transcriptional regulator